MPGSLPADDFLLDKPVCAEQAGTWCQRVYDLTHNDWVSRSADWLIAKPAAILMIIIVVLGTAIVLILGVLGLNLAPILASAGIVGFALGFGAQNLVKDFLSGIFMMLEDQYGVGDIVDLGDASGTVEAVGLRITTVRDAHGVVWYIRNGEIIRVGNKSQGWAVVNID